ncbi:MAG: hypothetical protein AB7R77_11840 [Ilumatobacteraceae bacterium]
MATAQQLEQRVVIVVLGAFNPSIFHPSWFGQEQLLRAEDAEAAQLEIAHPEITIFQLDWLRFEATRDRLAVHSLRESHYEAARDLVVGALELLRHTPTRALGVNHNVVVECGSREAFDNLGWELVPRESWVSILERPGMVRLDEQGLRTDGREGYIRVRVEPIMDGGTKVLLEVNDHFEVSVKNSAKSTEEIRTLLLGDWNSITRRATDIMHHMKGLIR